MTDYPVQAYLHESGETYGRYINPFKAQKFSSDYKLSEAYQRFETLADSTALPFPGAEIGRVYQKEEVEVVCQVEYPDGLYPGQYRDVKPNEIDNLIALNRNTRLIFRLCQQESAERCNQQGLITENDQQSKVATQYLTCENGKVFPMSEIRKQGGLKREIVDLCLSAAAPDDDCMLADFLMALQHILDKHQKKQNPT